MKQLAKLETIFLRDTQPLLPQAVRWLCERYAQTTRLDLSELICVLPSAHAQRRLESLLRWEAEEQDLTLTLPSLATVGALADLLCDQPRPHAIEFERTLAWAHVLQSTDRQRLGILSPALASGDGGFNSWLDLAATLNRLHDELASSRVTFADVAQAAEHRLDQDRWRLLELLFSQYLKTLADAGLGDPSQTRADAVADGRCRCDRTIVLIGTSDLSEALLAMLRELESPKIAMVAAPEQPSHRFHEFGNLKIDLWQQHLLPLEDRHLIPAGDIFDQSLAVAETLADFGERFSADEITVGVTDESQVGPVEIELEARGLQVHRQLGWMLSQTAVGRLLNLMTQFLERRTWASLAALVRHADVYNWLSRQIAGESAMAGAAPAAPPGEPTSRDARASEAASAWLVQLDGLLANHFPVQVDQPLPLAAARQYPLAERVREIVLQWSAPLSAGEHRISQWCLWIDQWLGEIAVDAEPPAATDDRTRAAYQAMRRQLKRYAALNPALDVPVNAIGALEMLIARSAEIRVGGPADPNEIELLGWLDLALDDAPALVVVGLNHPFVPEAVTSDPFLPGALRSRLGILDNERRYARDCYAMHLMLRSRAAVRFIVGKNSADGSPTPPSRLIAATTPEDCARHVRHLLASTREPVSLWHPWDDVPRDRPLRIPAIDTSHTVKTMSVTAFRDYLACPYRFYLRHVLKLRPIDDSTSELAANQFGDLVHAAVERFGKSPDKDLTRVSKIRESLVEHLHAYANETFGDSVSTAVRLQIAQAERRLRVVAERQAERAQEGWIIQKVEASVDEKGGGGIEIGGRTMGLRGRFDRIDFHPATGRWAILDYKTHGHLPEKKHLAKRDGREQWIDLQLPLYRRMIPLLGIDADPDDVQLGYFNVSARDEETGIHLAEFTPEQLRSADELILQCVRNVLAGRFEPSQDPVEYDDYDMILHTGIAERMLRADEHEEVGI